MLKVSRAGSSFTGMTNCPSNASRANALCRTNGRVLSGFIFGMLRETLDVLVMITDPEKVRETLEQLEKEPGTGHATHA